MPAELPPRFLLAASALALASGAPAGDLSNRVITHLDGLGAAGNALDPADRDRAFGARRILGDYARLSRYAGGSRPARPTSIAA